MAAGRSQFERLSSRSAQIPLVFLPGLFMGRPMWEPVLAQCAQREREALVSAKSYLKMPGAGATVEELADELSEALASAGVPRATLVGASFGGLIALEFAKRHAARLDRLVLCGAPGFGGGFQTGIRTRRAMT
ncbi:MAG TPA: alpha/beta hydrolase, partial [Candidatus Baltobacteraceae bacterium]|nr:alpha/beta hydrolase [Candidatus Baltobacteraceae bacterium]